MFDYRYHALSLAAVLFALAVGVLIGVAIGDSSLVSSAREGIVSNLRAEVGESQHKAAQLGGRLIEEENLSNDLYPIAVHGVLSGRNIGLVFFGESSDRVDTLVRDAVTQAGGNLRAVAVVREPLNVGGLAAQAGSTRYVALPSDPALAKPFGVRIGRQLIVGGQLLEREQRTLFEPYAGELGKLDGVVVARMDPSAMKPQDAKLAGEFQSGLLAGVAAQGVTAVGVELTSAEPSQVSWYKGEGLSSVDDLDTLGGRAALAFALAGDRGTYGVKSTADSLLPVVGGSG